MPNGTITSTDRPKAVKARRSVLPISAAIAGKFSTMATAVCQGPGNSTVS